MPLKPPMYEPRNQDQELSPQPRERTPETSPLSGAARPTPFRDRDPYEDWYGNPDVPASQYRRAFWEESQAVQLSADDRGKTLPPAVSPAEPDYESRALHGDEADARAEAAQPRGGEDGQPGEPSPGRFADSLPAPRMPGLSGAVNPNEALPDRLNASEEHAASPPGPRAPRGSPAGDERRAAAPAAEESADYDMPPPFWHPLAAGEGQSAAPENPAGQLPPSPVDRPEDQPPVRPVAQSTEELPAAPGASRETTSQREERGEERSDRDEAASCESVRAAEIAEAAEPAADGRPLTNLLQIAKTIDVGDERLSQLYDSRQLDELGLRRVVDSFLSGQHPAAVLERERRRYDSRFERDPQLRHKSYPPGNRAAPSADAGDSDSSQPAAASEDSGQQPPSWNPPRPRASAGGQAAGLPASLPVKSQRRFGLVIAVIVIYLAVALLLTL